MRKQTVQRYFCSGLVSLLLLSSLFFGILARATNDDVGSLETSSVTITHLSTNKASVGETVSVFGSGFGPSQGYVVVSGLVVEPVSWSDTEVVFIVPEHAASGFLYVRNALLIKSNIHELTIDRNLFQLQFEPYGFTLEETGLLGSAFLVETDGDYLYGITGFETLCTYKINEDGPFELCSIISLPQRVGDLRIHNGYLFVSGDHGLYVFRNSDLQQGETTPVAALAGASYLTMDAKEKTGQPIEGTLLALCEYVPTVHTQVLRVPLFQFEDEELVLLGTFSRTVLNTERQHALAIDPLNPKVYVSGYKTLLGEDKYLLEIDISDPSSPSLNHRLETGKLLGFDMDAKNDILWMGILSTGTEFFRTYRLKGGTDHLVLDGTVHGAYGLGRTTRVRIIDDFATVGSAWSGARPDVFLLDTFDSDSSPLASIDSLDWAFDVTGYAIDEQDGRIIVADEWGGFLTYEYELSPVPSITHQQDYRWTPASAMTENLYLTDERIYAANRGAGIWSADRFDVSDSSNWRYSEWDWELDDPQPYPISALCVREDPTHGTLIAARGNNKAMAWGSTHYGILYRETSTSIEQLAISDEFNPPFSLFSGSPGFSVVWPEPDLVYMATGTDGFRAFVLDPEEPSITIHKDCRDEGFGRSHFGTNRTVSDLYYYTLGHEHKMVIASTFSPFVNEPTITVLDISYPDGIPDRHNPDRAIHVSFNSSLNCLTGKSITYFDVSPSGLVAAATSQGIAVFHLSWLPALNEMSNIQAWSRIKIPEDSYVPYWDASFSSSFIDVSFGDEQMLYAVKNPQGKNPGGLWAIDVQVDWDHYAHNCLVVGYYPGVQCGIDHNNFLQGWGNPDIVTLHHPYALESEGNTVFVTGWSGKIDRLTFNTDNSPPVPPSHDPSNGNTVEDGSPPPDTTQPPIANATVDKNIGIPGEMFTFDASNSDAFDGGIVNYTWDFDDGTIISTDESMVTHAFTLISVYQVMLTVEDDQGLTNMLDNPLIIEILPVNAPPENLVVTPETMWIHKNTNVTFVMNATDPDVNDTIRFEIDWGDGKTLVSDHIGSGELFQTSHQWDRFGEYIVTIIAVDNHNSSSVPVTTTMQVDVIVIEDVINGWLIDMDSDGTFDLFKNLVTSERTTIEEQDDGRYLIDSNTDGEWDYIYCSTDGVMKYTEETPDETPGFTLIMLLLSLFFCIVTRMKKRRNKTIKHLTIFY